MMSKTHANIYNRLKRLEKDILAANLQTKALHNRFLKTRFGNRQNPKFANLNENALTRNVYRKYLENALKLHYNVYNPLIEKYKRASNKYRVKVGLPRLRFIGNKTIGHEFPGMVNYISSKKPNVALNYGNVTNLTNNYKNRRLRPQLGTGGGAHHAYISVGIPKYNFAPNKNLLNTLRPERNKTYVTIIKTLQNKGLPPNVVRKIVNRRK